MPISFYDVTVSSHLKSLKILTHILQLAETHANEKNIPLADVCEWRLISDMLPLSFQIKTVCNAAKNFLKFAAHLDVPAAADDEKTFDDLKARIKATEDLLEGVKRSDVDGKEDVEADVPAAWGKFGKFTGWEFAQGVSNANVAFHLVTAYNICRAKGVIVGKMDYLKGNDDLQVLKSQFGAQS
jgi:uncharacterized protein